MNRSAWISTLMKSNVPQNMMKMFGYRRKRNRSMTYSIMGVVASAAAALIFRNRMGDGMRQLFQNSNAGAAFNKPMAGGITEFAKEITSGLDSNKANSTTGFHSTTSTNPESSQMINQIASAAKETGNSQQVDQLANQLIKRNL
jgi:gas vesicle protein